MGEKAGEVTERIKRNIDQERNELGRNVQELEQRVKSRVEDVKSSLDWRARFREKPMMMLGLAFGGGLLLSRLGHSRSAGCGPGSWDT
jgi:predicted alpha/beta-fold hydrolase